MGLCELMHCDAIYLLNGYENSTGATLEHDYARTVGLEILREDEPLRETPEKNLLTYLKIAENIEADNTSIKAADVSILRKALEAYIEQSD